MGDVSSFFGDQAFDRDSVEPIRDYGILPDGQYPSLIEVSEVQATKAKNGHFIFLEMNILEGEFKNQKIFDRINIDNPSEKCVEMGKRSLAALCYAADVQGFNDTSQLTNKIVIAHVKTKDDRNFVRTYSSPSATVASAGPPVAPPSAAPSTSGKEPWLKK